ncbi:MAG: ABC transporter ATP-binding protein [Acetatifactor sp.]
MKETTEKKFSLFPYLWQYKRHYLLGILVLMAVDMASLYIPQYTGEIIDGLTGDTLDFTGVKSILYKILCAGLIMMAGRFGWRYFIIGASRGVEYHMRNDLFNHLETLSARFFNSRKTGDLMAHFTNDLQAIRMGVGMAVITTFDAVVMTLMVLVKMIVYVDLRLTVLAFIPLILVAVGCYFYGIEAKKRQTRRQEAFSHLSDKVQESLTGVRVLKSFVQEEADFCSFEEAAINSMEKNLSTVKLRAVFGPALDAVTGISLLLTLVFGGKMVLNGQVSIGQFVAFNSYIGMLVWPMIACGDCINSFSQASAAFQRIAAIFREKPDITDAPETDLPEGVPTRMSLSGEIELNHLTFTYPDGEAPVLKNISLKIRPGEMLGILGRTGCGKSSLADLLLRVYDCEKGMLLLDGIPISEIPLAVLHRDMAYVPQDNFLFSDTLEENIAFGLDERISDHPEIRDSILRAAKDACIHENIMDFPDNYATLVGERGVTLSGGQKQRSSIARALLKDSSILILDDSLSAVDTGTEEQILENILHLRRGKTTIVIAHRISTLQKADHIAVLTEGELTEYGTHEELVSLGGFYAHINEKQQLEQELTNLGAE